MNQVANLQIFVECRLLTEYILNNVGPLIAKTDTIMRKAIPAQERLAITLRFLASGDSFKSLSFLFKVSTQTVSRCVHETCDALIKVLQNEIKVNYKTLSIFFV